MVQQQCLDCEAPANRLGRNINYAGITLAFGAMLLLLLSGVGARLGFWHFRVGFTLLKYAAGIGAIAALTSCVGIFVSFGVAHHQRIILGIAAFCVALTTVAFPLYWYIAAKRYPKIHDISTDLVSPPVFVAILPLRKDAVNPPEYGGVEIAVKQRQAYPDIKSLVVNLVVEQAQIKALAIAKAMHWQVVAVTPGEGRIEATATTRWFGFKDDIVIRITPAGNRSVVDIRSVSRVGVSDVGTNARRIRAFLKEIAT